MSVDRNKATALRRALNYLYDPGVLGKSPLLDQVAENEQPGSSSNLRRVLERAIESLKPQAGVPPQSRFWRVYEILHYRYIQQCGQQEVADQLGLSLRQLKREQRRALQLLAQRLNEHFGWTLPLDVEERDEETQEAELVPADIEQELAWLREAPTKAVDLEEMLPLVIALAQNLARQHRVDLGPVSVRDVPALTVHGVALRQALLSLLTVAIRRSSEGSVRVSAGPAQNGAQIIVAADPRQPIPSQPQDAADVAVAQELIKASGGCLSVDIDVSFVARLLLPAAAQWTILVIDDNLDALRLLERYALGTRYRIVGVQNAIQALDTAAQIAPQAIILDVMMPDLDGWELLGRLRQHPLTEHIPVIASTILAQEELAHSLGISEFLRKPISREAFLAALDRLATTWYQTPR